MKVLSAVVAALLSGLAQAPPHTSQAIPYDDGVTWSWEEKASPIDIYDFIENMPFNQWQVIDERTCRALFENIIQKVLSQWGQPQGGKLNPSYSSHLIHAWLGWRVERGEGTSLRTEGRPRLISQQK